MMFENECFMWGVVVLLIFVMMAFGMISRVLDLMGKTLNRGTILLGLYMLVQKRLPSVLPKPKEKQPEDN